MRLTLTVVIVTATALAIASSATALVAQHQPVAAQDGCSDSCDLAAHRAAQQVVASTGSMPGMVSGASASNMRGMTGGSGDAAMAHVMQSAHMTMTPSRPSSPGDRARADRIVAALRVAIAPYHDYRAAEADGYQPFHPEWKLPMYHFTNWRNAIANLASFDPARPTSLMYKRVPGGYELEGAMYTAPRAATPEELDARVPLSVATWHEHTNLCLPPPGENREAFGPDARFGLAGSIATADACAQAGGRFVPVVFNWMVHVWPFESDPSKVWASEEHPGALGH